MVILHIYFDIWSLIRFNFIYAAQSLSELDYHTKISNKRLVI